MKQSANHLDRMIGANIRFYRLQRGWTQERLAEALDISFQQLGKFERGANRVSAARLFLIADLFGVSTEGFFGAHR